MQDAKGKEIKAGQTLRRIVDGRAVDTGFIYRVISRKWDDEQSESLVADGGFVQELITPDRAKEYEVV